MALALLMHKFLRNPTGKVSTLFIVICAILICSILIYLAIGGVYQLSTFQTNKNAIEQAEYEQAYGKPSGPSNNSKTIQSSIQIQRNENTSAQNKLKNEWLDRFDSVIKAQDISQLKQTVTDLKQAALRQEYQIQILQELITKAVHDHEPEVLISLLAAGSPLVSCKIHLLEGEKLLKYALENEDTEPFKTLVQADCIKGHSPAQNNLISYIVKSTEPRRSKLFKALHSSSELQVSVVKAMLAENDQTGITEYLAQNQLNKDFTLDNLTLLSYSILHDKPIVTEKLLKMGAARKTDSSIYNHAFLLALKKQDLIHFSQLVNTYPEDLNDPDLIRKIFESTKNDRRFQVAQILFDHYPEIILADNISRNLLSYAVMQGRYEQVKFLLEKGLSPNTIIGKQTLLALAIERTTANSQQVINILRSFGAIEDPLELIRQQRGISNNAECTYAKTESVDQKVFSTAYQLLKQHAKTDDVSTWPQIQICEASLVYCKNQGFSLDACMVSVPSCGTAACCPSDVKNNYFEGRCAGLGVTETIYWMAVFSTAYGVPINFRD